VLTKTASATDVPVGGTFTYTIDLTNDGPQTATGVVVTDTLSSDLTYVSDTCGGSGAPNWTWNVGTLAADASTSCTITVSLNDCNIITNTATATCQRDRPAGQQHRHGDDQPERGRSAGRLLRGGHAESVLERGVDQLRDAALRPRRLR
jgi:uncharacterized repeat protein (TIGR01451 family)